MSPSDNNIQNEQAWRDQVQASATHKLAKALAAQQAANPASNALEFQQNLGHAIAQLAHEELVLIEQMTGMALLEKLILAQTDPSVTFTHAQARQAGAFLEEALDDQTASDGSAEMNQDQDPQGVVS